ncbi:response regulator transcription factor [Cytobacillus oceanisediminis]|uniref:Two-component system response regulator ResD n=1 Tax=Cytobacillus oceanisediminis TaxID=665099 RepID=A0A562JCE8_9BACI|nr:response regulator transcription factor [Cytobacillus oceanisediminis]TWH80862.1 two-component system response regulator ResD [Cytobacillus oceanisediminis]
MKKEKILVVDDEWNMRQLLNIQLSSRFDIKEAGSGIEALDVLKKEMVDLVILDLMMPDLDGWQVCKKIRETSQVPILMLTARGDVKDKVQGFTVGADDYLVKPFNPEELLARSKALIRRSTLSSESNPQSEGIIEISELKIDQNQRQVFIKNDLLEVTPKEFDLIQLLVLNPRITFTRDMLLDHIWGIHGVLDIRTVDSHVKNVREKFRKNNLSFNPIKTVWGRGYKFQAPEEAQ